MGFHQFKETVKIEPRIGLAREIKDTYGVVCIGRCNHMIFPRYICINGAQTAFFKFREDFISILWVKAEVLNLAAEDLFCGNVHFFLS